MNENLNEYMQENILKILIEDNLNSKLIIHNLKANYFESSFHRKIFSKIISFNDRFKNSPGDHIYELLYDEIDDNDIYIEIIESIKNSDINVKYVIEQLNDFVRQQQLKIGILSAADEIEKGNILEAENHLSDLRKNDIQVFDKGSYIDSNFLDENAIETIPIGIDPLDEIGACPTKKEMIALGALPGFGKSHFLTHVGKVAMNTRHKVLHITLEMSQELQKQRYIQSFFNVTKRLSSSMINIFNKDDSGYLIDYEEDEIEYKLNLQDEEIRDKIDKKLKGLPCKNLIVKAFPSGYLTIPMLENYIDTLIDYENFHPDVIVLDYPKKMRLNPRYLREELGNTYIQLKGIADKYNAAVVIVAQFNRGAKLEKVNWIDESYLQEDFSLINEVAWFFTYNQTPYEYESKLARLFISKGRNDIKGGRVLLSQDYNCCQFALDSVKLKRDSDYKIKE